MGSPWIFMQGEFARAGAKKALRETSRFDNDLR